MNNNDLISRQAAIDALKVAYWDKEIQSAKDDPCIVDAMTDWAIRIIKELPSADVPDTNIGEWTPCSEGLPKATGLYMCTVNRELFDVRTMKFEMLAEGGYRWLLMNGSEVFPSFVLAWMPSPKPWKGVDDE